MPSHKITRSLLLFGLLLQISGCAFRRVTSEKDITYLAGNLSKGNKIQQLDVYAPHKKQEPKKVLLFIHGGNWNSGDKKLYSFLGNRLARKNIVTVIISYPLSPAADYRQMENAVAASVKWVQQNIARYGGDPNSIFLSGHSAGGHLAALVALRQDTAQSQRMVKGAILIDAAGLDMYGYLQEEKFGPGHTYLKTFTSDPANWKDATPLYHLHQDMVPMLLFRGGKTYPSIAKSTETFMSEAVKYTPTPIYKIQKGKHHIPMILQFFWTWNPRYKDIKNFMNSVAE